MATSWTWDKMFKGERLACVLRNIRIAKEDRWALIYSVFPYRQELPGRLYHGIGSVRGKDITSTRPHLQGLKNNINGNRKDIPSDR